MQRIERQNPYWMEPVSNVLNQLTTGVGALGKAHLEAKGKKQVAKIEKENREREREQQAQAMAHAGIPYEKARAFLLAPPNIQTEMIDRGLLFGRGGPQGMPGQGMQQGGMGMGMQQQPMMGQQPPEMANLQGLGNMQQGMPQQEQIPYGGMSMMQAGQSMPGNQPGSFLAQRVLQGAGAGMKPSATQNQLPPKQQRKKDIGEAVTNYDIDSGIDMMGMGMPKKQYDDAVKVSREYDGRLSEELHASGGLGKTMDEMLRLIDKDIKSGGKLLRGPGAHTIKESLERGHGKAAAAGVGGLLGALIGSIVPGVGTAVGATLGGTLGGGLGTAVGIGTEAYLKSNATKETQQYEKLSAEFIKGAKSVFGGRVTNNDLEAFLKMVPTLYNTNEGKIAIIRNLQLVNEGTEIKGEVAKEIKKRNGGSLPPDFERMVEDASRPLIDKLEKQWRDDTEKLFAMYEKMQPEQQVEQGVQQAAGSRGPRVL